MEDGVLVMAFVLIDLHQLLRLVLPSELDGTALRAAGVIPQNLRIDPDLTSSKGDAAAAAAAAVVRRQCCYRQGLLATRGFRSKGGRRRLSFQRGPGEDVMVMVVVLIGFVVMGMLVVELIGFVVMGMVVGVVVFVVFPPPMGEVELKQ